jgi:hypothetical protein
VNFQLQTLLFQTQLVPPCDFLVSKFAFEWVNLHRYSASVLPFDSLGMFMGGGQGKQLKILRIVRLLRLLKLLRIIRSGRIFARLEAALNMNYGVLQLTKFVLWTIIIAHWMACAYHMITLIESMEYMCIGGPDGPIDPGRAEAMDCSWVTNYFGGDFDWRQRYVVRRCAQVEMQPTHNSKARLVTTLCSYIM